MRYVFRKTTERNEIVNRLKQLDQWLEDGGVSEEEENGELDECHQYEKQ